MQQKRFNAHTNTACLPVLLLILLHYYSCAPDSHAKMYFSRVDESFLFPANGLYNQQSIVSHAEVEVALHSNRLTLTTCPAEPTIKTYISSNKYNSNQGEGNSNKHTHKTKTCTARNILYIYIYRRDTQMVDVQIAVPQHSRQTAGNTKRYLLVVKIHRRENIAPLAV